MCTDHEYCGNVEYFRGLVETRGVEGVGWRIGKIMVVVC